MSKKSYRIIKIILFFNLICSFFCFAQEVLNPVDGVWSNKQTLVLDIPVGSNAYYSLSGNDPESSGFAYDGPVLLDVEGDVLLKVSIVNSNGEKYKKDVIYSVKKAAYPDIIESYEFIKNTVELGIVDYVAGDTFKIPSSLDYCFGKLQECYEKGNELKISEKAIFSRYIPCTVTDGNGKWRFVFHINPVMTGIFSRRDVPFEIIDWNTISFSNKKYIYKIDDGWWQQPKLPIKIDRTTNHMISWQPIDFSSENSVKFFVLPPQPEIKNDKDINGAVSVSYSGEPGYKFGIIDYSGNISELYESFKIDTFKGDIYTGSCKVGVFYDSVYQGDFLIDYKVNKKIPQKPIINSSAQNNFSRKLVTLNIQSSSESDLYVSVCGPVVVDSDNTTDEVLFNLQKNDFKKVSSNRIVLHPSNEGAVAYKVQAYSEDSNKNKSNMAEYKVVIDTYNYYLNSKIKSSVNDLYADGTIDRPYTSFEQILPFINENKFSNVILDGEIYMPDKNLSITSNIQLKGKDDARIVFPSKSSLFIHNSSFVVTDCVISYAAKKTNSAENEITKNLIQLDKSVLDFNNVELSAAFSKNGTIINCDNSVVSIKNSGITSSADFYSSVIASVDSKINIKQSKITTVSGTSIIFSAQGGIFELRSSNCNIIGTMGRIGELFDTQSSITDNTFQAELKKNPNKNEPIYADSRNMSIEYSGNNATGF